VLRLNLLPALKLCQLDDQTQRLVHGLGAWKRPRDIRLQQDQIRSFPVTLGIFATNPAFEQLGQVVLRA